VGGKRGFIERAGALTCACTKSSRSANRYTHSTSSASRTAFSASHPHCTRCSSTDALTPPGRERSSCATLLAVGLAPIAALMSDSTACTTSGRGSGSPSAEGDDAAPIELKKPRALSLTRSKLSDACLRADPDSPTKS
jgi:hypothetical protein